MKDIYIAYIIAMLIAGFMSGVGILVLCDRIDHKVKCEIEDPLAFEKGGGLCID